MKIIPLTKNVLIDIHKIKETAMQMIDENESKTEQATVLSVGNDVDLVKVGDIIIFKNYNLDTIEIEGEKFNLIPEEDIKAICYDGFNSVWFPTLEGKFSLKEFNELVEKNKPNLINFTPEQEEQYRYLLNYPNTRNLTFNGIPICTPTTTE